MAYENDYEIYKKRPLKTGNDEWYVGLDDKKLIDESIEAWGAKGFKIASTLYVKDEIWVFFSKPTDDDD